MNWLRYALIAAIFAVSYILFLEWNAFSDRQKSEVKAPQSYQSQNKQTQETNPTLVAPESAANTELLAAEDSAPSLNLPSQNTVDSEEVKALVTTTQKISVKSDVLDLLIDTDGGDLVYASLRNYREDIDDLDSTFTILEETQAKTYIAESGLSRASGSNARIKYNSTADSYVLKDGQDELVIELKASIDDLIVTKIYKVKRDSYLIDINYIVENQGSATLHTAPFGRIKRSDFDVESTSGIGMKPYLGAAITSPDTNYNKIDFEDIEENNCDFSPEDERECVLDNKGGWVAMVQHYFISAWVPNQTDDNVYKLRKYNSGKYSLEYLGATVSIPAGQSGEITSQFYVGPKNLKRLEAVAPHLDLTLDFSWLFFIAKPLHIALIFIQSFVTNWGLAIVLLTLCIKVIFFYPSAISYRSMAKMRKVQPLVAELKEQCGDDRQKMSVEMMKLYKREKVSPFGGCLPILLQMPVFIALYWTLMETVELRHAPFIFWIKDLSDMDPYFILPLIMGATMFIQQKLNPTPPDPMQAKVMQLMPIFFTVLFLWFPSGLVLYWVVNNTLSITQQYIITRQIEKQG
jgi:YidC/Oxa1 family membrane protein insertase